MAQRVSQETVEAVIVGTPTVRLSQLTVEAVIPALLSAEPPTLVSIAVTPADATIDTDDTQQYVATGTYSDSSTADITDEVTWSSSNPAAATINSTGLATAVGVGDTTIAADE